MMKHHLAQFNVARARYPIDDPRIADFVAQVLYVNALADDTPGFVWRLHDESGNNLRIYPYGDPLVLVTFSIWESFEAVFEFTYRGYHAVTMQDRRQWFEHIEEPYIVLWWIPAGHIPDLEEAKERLAHLRHEGPTPWAFDFKHPFPAPAAGETYEPARPPTSKGSAVADGLTSSRTAAASSATVGPWKS